MLGVAIIVLTSRSALSIERLLTMKRYPGKALTNTQSAS